MENSEKWGRVFDVLTFIQIFAILVVITRQACPRKRVLLVPRQRVSLEGDFLYSQKIGFFCQALSTTDLWKTPRKRKTPGLVMVLVSFWLKIWRVNRGENH